MGGEAMSDEIRAALWRLMIGLERPSCLEEWRERAGGPRAVGESSKQKRELRNAA